jgi:site-specific DNA-methyltransferase (adenine-specific)
VLPHLIDGVRLNPYYEHAGITIYHGDCRDILPSLPSVDLVLTDPPYGVNKKYESYIDTPAKYADLISSAIPLIFAMSNKRLVTCGVGNVWKWPEADWILCWFKPNAMTRSAVANANVWEPILVYGCKGFGVDGKTFPIAPQLLDHPCPKPLNLFRWLVSKACDDGATVLDPFMGSGTTLEAAKGLGRRAIGIEIEERYCEIAAKRLGQEVLDFNEAPALV